MVETSSGGMCLFNLTDQVASNCYLRNHQIASVSFPCIIVTKLSLQGPSFSWTRPTWPACVYIHILTAHVFKHVICLPHIFSSKRYINFFAVTLLHPKNLCLSVLKASFVSTIKKTQPPTKVPLIHQTRRRFTRSFSPCLGQGYCADYGYFDRFLGQDPSRGGCWSERMNYPLRGKRKIRWMILNEEYINMKVCTWAWNGDQLK